MLHLQWLLGIGYELRLLILRLVPAALSSSKADLPFNHPTQQRLSFLMRYIAEVAPSNFQKQCLLLEASKTDFHLGTGPVRRRRRPSQDVGMQEARVTSGFHEALVSYQFGCPSFRPFKHGYPGEGQIYLKFSFPRFFVSTSRSRIPEPSRNGETETLKSGKYPSRWYSRRNEDTLYIPSRIPQNPSPTHSILLIPFNSTDLPQILTSIIRTHGIKGLFRLQRARHLEFCKKQDQILFIRSLPKPPVVKTRLPRTENKYFSQRPLRPPRRSHGINPCIEVW